MALRRCRHVTWRLQWQTFAINRKPETGSCTVLGFDGLGKPHRRVYMLLTIILCQALALPFYNLIVVKNLQTVSNSAIRAKGTAGDLSVALGCSCGRKMSRNTA
jgi:hypothetical protein